MLSVLIGCVSCGSVRLMGPHDSHDEGGDGDGGVN